MGTRCITVVEDEDGTELCRIYRQFDGYPEVHGKQITEFLSRGNIEHMLGIDDEENFLGMQDVAASLVAFLKSYTEPTVLRHEPTAGWHPPISGGNRIQLVPIGTHDVGEEYIYTVSFQGVGKPPLVRVVNTYTGEVNVLLE